MSKKHNIYLNLGSNIQPEIHLRRAIELLQQYGDVKQVSNGWASHAVGMDGPDFINACVLFVTDISPSELKEKIVRPIEHKLGRQRDGIKNTPRTIDIDVVIVDQEPIATENWRDAFLIVPLAEIAPDATHPELKIKMSEAANQIREKTWIEMRPDIFKSTSN